MKKLFCILLCTLMLAFTGCGKDLPAIETIGVDNFETVETEFAGCTRDDLIKAWGEPAVSLDDGMFGDIWELEGELETLLNVYYNTDGSYNSAMISYLLAYTGTVTEILPKSSGDAALYTITAELDDGSTVVLDTTPTTAFTGADQLNVGNRVNFICSAMTGSQYLQIQSAEIIG